MEIKRAGKHTDAPNYQVHEIWWICFESARHRHTEVFVQRLPLNPPAKLIPQPKYATAPRMAAGKGVGGGEGCQALLRDRRTTHHDPGWREDGWSRMEASGVWHRLAFSTLHHARCTWLHYFSCLAGNQQWCLRASKTTLWIINAQDLKKITLRIINVFGASFKLSLWNR